MVPCEAIFPLVEMAPISSPKDIHSRFSKLCSQGAYVCSGEPIISKFPKGATCNTHQGALKASCALQRGALIRYWAVDIAINTHHIHSLTVNC